MTRFSDLGKGSVNFQDKDGVAAAFSDVGQGVEQPTWLNTKDACDFLSLAEVFDWSVNVGLLDSLEVEDDFRLTLTLAEGDTITFSESLFFGRIIDLSDSLGLASTSSIRPMLAEVDSITVGDAAPAVHPLIGEADSLGLSSALDFMSALLSETEVLALTDTLSTVATTTQPGDTAVAQDTLLELKTGYGEYGYGEHGYGGYTSKAV
jgi:hypothetical protein